MKKEFSVCFFVSLKLTIKAINLHYGIFLTILLLKKYSNILSVRFCKVPTHKNRKILNH
ncbi:hypothetical protein LEP1GSC013_4470 [Leptospira interrogans serovar Valbuzzi str. Duyster]|nr:hypothetical protein LEP1GSC013_4470 [Leptospira interrogans serovar Valbuzzi str. Duyster]